MSHGYARICQFPDLSYRIFESAVAIYHNFNMLSGLFKNLALHFQYQVCAVSREQFHGFLRRFIRSKKPEAFIASASVHRTGQDIVQSQNNLGAILLQDALGPCPGMYVTGQHVLGMLQDFLRLVCEDNFHFSPCLFDQIAVILHIIHASKWMLILSEQFAVFLKIHHVAVWVNACIIKLVQGNQFISHFVAWVAQHEYYLLRAFCDTLQTDGETVSRQNRKDDSYSLSAQFRLDILGYRIDRRIVSLRSCHDGFCGCNHVAVTKLESFAFCCL